MSGASRPVELAPHRPLASARHRRLTRSRLLKLWLRKFSEDRCTLLAAALAYRALFSIIPMTALLVAGASQVLKIREIRHEVVNRVIERIPIGRGLVIDALQAISDSTQPLTLLGILLLLWTAIGMFSTVRETLNVAWNVRPRGLLGQKLVEVAGVLALGSLVLLSVAGTAMLHAIRNFGVAWLGDPDPQHSWVLEPATAVFTGLLTFVAFVLVYRFVPHVKHGFRDVIPGAALGTVLFETAKHAFAFYVSHFSRHEVYGALGTVMVFQLWVYVSATIFLGCAELNAILGGALPPSLRDCTDDPDVLDRAMQTRPVADAQRAGEGSSGSRSTTRG